MIIKRIKSFTKKSDNKKDIKSVVGGLGTVAGGYVAIDKLNKRFDKSTLSKDKKLSRENSKLFEKLEKEGEKQGTAVYRGKGAKKSWNGGFYSEGRLRGPYKYLDKQGIKPGKAGDLIISSKNADVLAHELGHSKYSKRGRARGIDGTIGRVSHKANIGSAYLGLPGLATSFMTGMNTGSIEEYRKSKGKKDSKLLRHASWGIPVISAVPVLAAEGMASRKGVKLLKKAGASKELLKKSKKRYRNAWGTYAASTIASAGSGEVGRVAGKRLMKKTIEYDKKHEERDKDNKNSKL